MTNEQLAILIRGYVSRLDELIKKLDDEMPEGAEQRLRWVKNDGSPALSPQDIFSTELIQAEAIGKSDTLKQVPNGDYICLDDLRQFSAELWTQVDELNAAKELRTLKSRRAK